MHCDMIDQEKRRASRRGKPAASDGEQPDNQRRGNQAPQRAHAQQQRSADAETDDGDEDGEIRHVTPFS